jgi:flagellar hook assembly protein FlgD
VRLRIFNIIGEEIKILVDEIQKSGVKFVKWDGRNDTGNPVTSGVYLYRIETGNTAKQNKMILLR